MKWVLGALALTSLAGCDVQATDPRSGSERVAIKADQQGKVAFDLPFARGEIKLPAEVMRSGTVDIAGVKLIPGGVVTGFDMNADGKGPASVNMTFTAPTSPAEVQAYFLREFQARSIAVQQLGQTITGVTRDGARFEIDLGGAGAGTSGTIRIAPPT